MYWLSSSLGFIDCTVNTSLLLEESVGVGFNCGVWVFVSWAGSFDCITVAACIDSKPCCCCKCLGSQDVDLTTVNSVHVANRLVDCVCLYVDLSALLAKRRIVSERENSPADAAQVETAPSGGAVSQKPVPITYRKPG